MNRFLLNKGYKVIKGVIPNQLLDNVVNVIAERFCDITKIKLKNKPLISSNISKEFYEHLVNLRIKNPKLFGFLYDSIQSSVALHQLLTYKKLIKKLSDLTDTPQELFSTSGHIQRIDLPTDKKNLYSWHQETSYYRQNSLGKNCYFIWIPFFDVSKNKGSVCLAEKSHLKGYLKTKVLKKNDVSSEQRNIDSKKLENYRHIQPKLTRGDVCVIHFNTIHRSGTDISNKLKLTAIGRYHYAKAPEFKPFRYTYKLNELLAKNKN